MATEYGDDGQPWGSVQEVEEEDSDGDLNGRSEHVLLPPSSGHPTLPQQQHSTPVTGESSKSNAPSSSLPQAAPGPPGVNGTTGGVGGFGTMGALSGTGESHHHDDDDDNAVTAEWALERTSLETSLQRQKERMTTLEQDLDEAWAEADEAQMARAQLEDKLVQMKGSSVSKDAFIGIAKAALEHDSAGSSALEHLNLGGGVKCDSVVSAVIGCMSKLGCDAVAREERARDQQQQALQWGVQLVQQAVQSFGGDGSEDEEEGEDRDSGTRAAAAG